MTRTKTFMLIIFVLMLSNLVAWFMLFSEKNRKPDRKAYTRDFLQKEIGFTNSQLTSFDSLVAVFRQSLIPEMENTRKKKSEVIKFVAADDFSDSAITIGAEKMASAQKDIELMNLKQVASIRALCTPDQLAVFDSNMDKMFRRKSGEKKRSGR